jgi:CRP-like cAMP-binding protein
MPDSLYTILHEFGISSAGAQKLFTEKCTSRVCPKNTVVFTERKKNDMEYLLVSGVAQRYNISEPGDMVTTGFYMGPSVITPHFARTSNGISIFNLSTLTEGVLLEIPVVELDHLRGSNSEIRDFGRKTIETELARIFYNEVVFRSYNARERLLELRRQFPNLENIVPLGTIASYLGITNVSFSRLRGELAGRP